MLENHLYYPINSKWRLYEFLNELAKPFEFIEFLNKKKNKVCYNQKTNLLTASHKAP